jgi:hypothetical protein
VSREDPALELPEAVSLAGPLGSLTHDLTASYETGDDAPFTLAGRRVGVAGGMARGADQVRVGTLAIATTPRVAGARCDGATITPLGLERRLRVAGHEVVERVVVPRDGAFVVFEWAAPGDAVVLDVRWTTHVALRWRGSADGTTVVSGDGDDRAVFAVDTPSSIRVLDAPDDVSALPIRALVAVPAAGSARVAMTGGAAQALGRALRPARHAGALVQARRGIVDRLRQDRLALDTPDPALDQAVEWAKVRLADQAPVPIGPSAGAAAAAGHGLDRLLLGDFAGALETLRWLGEREAAGGPGADRPSYVRLAAEYLRWTGDVAVIQAEWPGLRSVWHDIATADAPALDPAAREDLVHLAEAAGDAAAVAGIRAAPPGVFAARDLRATDPVLDRVRALLGAEPDAARGRLVLRPRPPADWDRLEARSLAMGGAVIRLRYHRVRATHRFTVSQEQGASPIRLILEPELVGRLRAARVDGAEAGLETVPAGERSRIPVQLALDHERTLELEMDEKEDARR